MKRKPNYPAIYWKVTEEYNGSDEMSYGEIKYDIENEYRRKVKELKKKELLAT